MPHPRLNATYITNLMGGAPLDKRIQTQHAQKQQHTNTRKFQMLNATPPADEHTDRQQALKYLMDERGFTKATLLKFGIGLALYKFPERNTNRYVDTQCITFPWLLTPREIQEQEDQRNLSFTHPGEEEDVTYLTRRIKVRALNNKGLQRLDPPGGGWGLFGWHTIPPDATSIIITEGEYDAMAVYQSTGRPAVSLPNGCRSLHRDVLPLLERFDKIYLHLGDDPAGVDGRNVFIEKLGPGRCFSIYLNKLQY